MAVFSHDIHPDRRRVFGTPPARAVFSPSGVARPRWGDYGAAVTDGKSIWIASEYIAQTCTLAEYTSAPFGSCGGTRAALGNWSTRVSKVTP